MTTGYEYVVDTNRDDGGIVVNGIDEDMFEYRPGQRLSLEMLFWDSDVDEASGSTFGGTTFGGATFGSGTLTDHIARYKAMREYGDYAGRFARNEAIDGTVHFAERVPASAPIDSIIVDVVPGDALPDTPGVWVLLEDVDDQTRYIDDLARIVFDGRVLARTSAYQDRADVVADIGSTL